MLRFLFLLSMELQGPLQDAGGGGNPNAASGGIPPIAAGEFRAQRPSIPFAPFFQSFAGAGNQMPFLYPYSFMPPLPGLGFTAPTHGTPSATFDLTEGSQKQGPQQVVTDHTKSNKKRRISQKNAEIVELDDAKDDVDLLKNVGHWKDH